MTAASSNPWNETPARRPSAIDFGADASGFVLRDEEVDQADNDIAPIKDGTQPYSAMFNRALEACATSAATMPALAVTVEFGMSGVVVASFISPRTTRQIEDIGVLSSGTGITVVSVADDTIPPVIGGPRVTVHGGTKPTFKAVPYSTTGYRGVTVTTWDDGTLANLPFTVEIM